MRLTSQTLLCDGVGSPQTSANLTRSSETRSRGNAAISAARFGSMGDSPKVNTARCPPPPSPLSLGSLRIARQAPRDFHRSLQFHKSPENLDISAGIALRCRTGLGSLAQHFGTADGAGP